MEEQSSKERALEIISRYLASWMRRDLAIDDQVPEGIYMRERVKGCWCVHVPDDYSHVGGGRVICISKRTGEILIDQILGE